MFVLFIWHLSAVSTIASNDLRACGVVKLQNKDIFFQILFPFVREVQDLENDCYEVEYKEPVFGSSTRELHIPKGYDLAAVESTYYLDDLRKEIKSKDANLEGYDILFYSDNKKNISPN